MSDETPDPTPSGLRDRKKKPRLEYFYGPMDGPPQDMWGVSDLWDVTDTHLRRPGEDLDEALRRWILFLLGNAAKAYLRFLRQILICAGLAVVVVQLTRCAG